MPNFGLSEHAFSVARRALEDPQPAITVLLPDED